MQSNAIQPHPRPAPHRRRNVAIALGVLIAVAFVAAEFRFTTVDVSVVSNRTTGAITFTFLWDGRAVGSGVLEPGQKTLYTVPLAWWFLACEPHTLSVVSSEGAAFPGSDRLNLTVCAGASYATALFV